MTSRVWSIDPKAAQEALELLRSARHVLFPTHQNVDVDGLASPLALLHGLRQIGVRGSVLISDGQLPKSLEFLPGIEEVLLYGRDELPEYDVLCMLDCSDERRLGAFYEDDPERVSGRVPIINIDHHITNPGFGTINIIEPKAASTAEIATDLIHMWNLRMTRPIAHCLLAGIYGDTLGLRTEATTARTMRTAADLVDAGANPAAITDALFRVKPVSSVCLWRKALDRVSWTGSLIWTEVSGDMLRECDASASEAEGLVNFLAGTEGSLAAAILYQNDHGWRVSLRSLSDAIDVASIAAEFGGGGHPRAAGSQIRGGPEERDAFLQRVSELAEEAWSAATASVQ